MPRQTPAHLHPLQWSHSSPLHGPAKSDSDQTLPALSLSSLRLIRPDVRCNLRDANASILIILKASSDPCPPQILLREVRLVCQKSPAHLLIPAVSGLALPLQSTLKPEPVIHLDIQRNHLLFPEVIAKPDIRLQRPFPRSNREAGHKTAASQFRSRPCPPLISRRRP